MTALVYINLRGVGKMEEEKVKVEEDILDDMDIYLEQSRDVEEDNDELEPWEVAWMKGYDDAG